MLFEIDVENRNVEYENTEIVKSSHEADFDKWNYILLIGNWDSIEVNSKFIRTLVFLFTILEINFMTKISGHVLFYLVQET